MPLLPLTLAGKRLPLRQDPPVLGEHTDQLLTELGYGADEIASMHESGLIGAHALNQASGDEPANA